MATTKARTSQQVKRTAAPPKTQRARQGNENAERHVRSLADMEESSGRAVLVHGDTGVGKTVLSIAKAPRPTLVLDSDGGLDSVMGLPDADKIDVWGPAKGDSDLSWEIMDAFRNYVISGSWQKSYKVIVVDNVVAAQRPVISSSLQEMYDLLADEKKAAFDLDVPSRPGWGKIYRKMDRWVRDIKSVKRLGVDVIFTAGSAEWEDDSGTKIYPNLEGKERTAIATHMDAIGWLEIDDGDRILHLAPTGAVVTKVRLPVPRHDRVPEEIKDPDFVKMMRAVRGMDQEEVKTTAAKPRKRTTTKRSK